MTNSQIESFQITTDQVHALSAIPQATTKDKSIVKQLGDDQVRIDNSNRSRHHMRAKQLSEFTDWLSNNNAASTSTPNESSRVVKTGTTTSTAQNHRIDSAAELRTPHFQTQGYAADPAEIKRVIQKLKADGRIIADSQQVTEQESTVVSTAPIASQSKSIINFTWPNVSSNLVGSPAILNLELNVSSPITQHFKQLVVTSTHEGTGATTVAISLARQLAQHNNRVMLVDANIKNAALTRQLGAGKTKSWVHTLSQKSSLSEVIWHDEVSPISLLPVAPIQTSVSWRRKIFNELTRIIDSIAWDFSFIIFDVGECSQFLAECDNPGNIADITLLVNGKNISGVADQRRAENQLVDSGVKQLLIVQNFSRINDLSASKVG